MKLHTLLLLLLFTPFVAAAQSTTHPFGEGFGKANKKSIYKKMDSLLEKVSSETKCPKTQIAYTVTEYYTGFYTHKSRHLPKKIQVEANGKKLTYIHQGLSGAAPDWVLGQWKLE